MPVFDSTQEPASEPEIVFSPSSKAPDGLSAASLTLLEKSVVSVMTTAYAEGEPTANAAKAMAAKTFSAFIMTPKLKLTNTQKLGLICVPMNRDGNLALAPKL